MKPDLAKNEPVTLVGAGTVPPERLARALHYAPTLWAVDGGADTALSLGHRPQAAIGDMDSISAQARTQVPLITADDQDYPDFDKALSMVQAPLIMALGFCGTRLDHTLAGLTALLRHPHQRVILDAGDDIACLIPPALALTLPIGTRLSLYPMRALRCGSSGLLWPTDGLVLDPFARIGTSNETRAPRVTLSPDGPAFFLMIPAQHLDPLIEALSAAPLWPRPVRAR